MRFLDNTSLGMPNRNRKTEARPASLKSRTGFWLRFVSNHVSHSFARKLSGSRVTVAEWVTLRQIFDARKASPSRIAASSPLTRGAVVATRKKLVTANERKKVPTT